MDDVGNDCLVSVDGVDFLFKGRKLDSGEPDPSYYSYKFRNSALRYEVAVSIRTSNIVWISGPYLPGVFNDLMIFRHGLIAYLDPNERVEADDIYKAEPLYCKCPHSLTAREDQQRMRGRLRRRHEKINIFLKNFHCLDVAFRHGGVKHGACVRAVAVLVQLSMEQGEQELCDMREYHDDMSDDQVALLYGL